MIDVQVDNPFYYIVFFLVGFLLCTLFVRDGNKAGKVIGEMFGFGLVYYIMLTVHSFVLSL